MPSARTLRRIAWLALAILLIGAFIWWKTRPKPVEVLVQSVSRGTVEATVSNTRAGTVEACQRSKLSPAAGGQIAVLDIHKGDEVKKGQILLELWNQDLKAQVALAKGEEKVSQAQARSACLQADVAAREADRQVKLRRQQLVSVEQVDKATTNAKS
ncbi:MAG: biotin/lipoyl-binding protein, partial [Gammaproteobacteria bacterium]